MKKIFALMIASGFWVGCTQPKEAIVNPRDYAAYLSPSPDKSLASCNEGISFWRDRLSANPDDEISSLKLAGLYSGRFKLNGKVEDMNTSDSLYESVLKTTPFGKEGIYQALATNCITRHQFRKAHEYVQKALEVGDNKAVSNLILVDVKLELGDYAGAKTILHDFTNKNSFAFLIREAKIKDHTGELDSAIVLMERAFERMKDNPALYLWTKSNIADMYGHAGRVEDAYQAYLQVLEKDPDYDYALKGIAWIAFSRDHNNDEARKIVNQIFPKRATPDLHLLLAQIADAENNGPEKEKQLELFTKAVADPKYGDMYNKYIAFLEAEEFSHPSKTIEIAEREIQNRPTPQSYDLLAWGYYKLGDVAKAIEIASDKIEGRTFEPEVLFHLGLIYQASDPDKSKGYLTKASKSSFELGPLIANRIKEELK